MTWRRRKKATSGGSSVASGGSIRDRSPAVERFGEVVRTIDQAKDALLSAVPSGRGEGVPLAEAVAAFEERLHEARAAVAAWPGDGDSEVRGRCASALDEALRRAEALRLEASPEGYDQLYTLLGDALDPLDVFDEVADRFLRSP